MTKGRKGRKVSQLNLLRHDQLRSVPDGLAVAPLGCHIRKIPHKDRT